MIYNREQLEANESQQLAPYGMRSKNTKGRAYLDNEPDYRTVFQREALRTGLATKACAGR